MIDLTRWIPPLILWILLSFLSFLYLKFYLIGSIVAHLVEVAPLDTDQVIENLELLRVDDNGMIVRLKTLVQNTKLPIDWLHVCITIPNVKIYFEEHRIAILGLSSPISVNGRSDISIDQELDVDLCQRVKDIKPLLQRVSIVGPSELKRIELKIQFVLSISINGYNLNDIECRKTLLLGDLKPPKDPKAFKNLFPAVEIIPSVKPSLSYINAGLQLKFKKQPGLKFSIERLSFRILLNGSAVADCTITNLALHGLNNNVNITIYPLAISSRPISGSLSTMKGVLKGAINGLANGMLYGEWGGQATVMGIQDIEIYVPGRVWWIDELFDGIEFEYDIDSVQQVHRKLNGSLERTNELVEGISAVIVGVLEASGCLVM